MYDNLEANYIARRMLASLTKQRKDFLQVLSKATKENISFYLYDNTLESIAIANIHEGFNCISEDYNSYFTVAVKKVYNYDTDKLVKLQTICNSKIASSCRYYIDARKIANTGFILCDLVSDLTNLLEVSFVDEFIWRCLGDIEIQRETFEDKVVAIFEENLMQLDYTLGQELNKIQKLLEHPMYKPFGLE